ncbi:MAG: SAM-dependent methyltransferase [Tannerellaceae bacterium]|jgi:predicted O-methyltransferase YrrM|nr:SAM-dependent methyltransferase [Tannerellaceae bacterium]
MLNIPTQKAFAKGLQTCRRILRRYGYGIHSPFVYYLITKVITERARFYCFDEIEALRRRLLADSTRIVGDGRRTCTVGHIVAREAIRPKVGALLFRLTNFLKPENILQIGPTTGLSTLYLSSYRLGLRCVAVERETEFASLARSVHRQARVEIEHYTGDYRDLLPEILAGIRRLDFVYLNVWREPLCQWIFDACLACKHSNTVVVVEGISRNNRMRAMWKYVRTHPEATVTFDLRSTGIVFFNPKLHRHDYKIYF